MIRTEVKTRPSWAPSTGKYQFAGDKDASADTPVASWLRVHATLASLLILVCAVTPRLYLAATADMKDLLKADSYVYLRLAENMIEHRTYATRLGRPEVSRPPGYPSFVAGLMLLLGKDLRKVLMLQACIVSCSVLLLYWLARLTLHPTAAFLGGLVAALSPWSVVLAAVLLSEGLFLVLLATILLVLRLIQQAAQFSRAFWGSLVVGVCTASAILVRPLWPLLWLNAGLLLVSYGPRRKGAVILVAAMLLTATIPLMTWQARNEREAQFRGLSDTPGITIWWYLASRVQSQLTGEDRFAIKDRAILEDSANTMPRQQADRARWARAKEIFQAHPVLTIYSFTLSAMEHLVHPSPEILSPAGWNFHGDRWWLGVAWFILVSLAVLGCWWAGEPALGQGAATRFWIWATLALCLTLTLLTGASFGSGSRMRAPLELAVPFAAGIGLLRIGRWCGRS